MKNNSSKYKIYTVDSFHEVFDTINKETVFVSVSFPITNFTCNWLNKTGKLPNTGKWYESKIYNKRGI